MGKLMKMIGKQKGNQTQSENNDKSKHTVGTGTVNNQNRENSCTNDSNFTCPHNMPLFIPPCPPFFMGCSSDVNPQMARGFIPFINPYMMPQCPYSMMPPCADLSGPRNSSAMICPYSQLLSSNMTPRKGASCYEFQPNCQEVCDGSGHLNENYKSQNASNQIAPMPQSTNVSKVSFSNPEQNNIHPQMTQPLSSQMGQQLSPQMGQQLPPQMTQPLSPQMGQQLSPQMGQQLPPQMGQQFSPQMGQQFFPQMGQQFSPQMCQQLPPQMDQQFSTRMDRCYSNNPHYQFNPTMTSTPINNKMTPNLSNIPRQYQDPVNTAEPVIEGVNNSYSDKCKMYKHGMPENPEPRFQNYVNIPYSCVEERFKNPTSNDLNLSPPSNIGNSISPCAKCCSKSPSADEEISSSKSSSNNESNLTNTTNSANANESEQSSNSEEMTEPNQCNKYSENPCSTANDKEENEDQVKDNKDDSRNPDLSFNPMANSTENQSVFSKATGPCSHCTRAPTSYVRNSMDGLRYNKYQYNDNCFSPFGTTQGSGFNASLPNPSGYYSINKFDSDQMRSNIIDGTSNIENEKCDCIYPPSLAQHKCCGKIYGNCQCVSKQN